MSDPHKTPPIDKLTQAYEQMLEHLHHAMQQTRESALPGLKEYLGEVREKMVELGELTKEEAETLAGYIERDIKDAAAYLSDTGEELSEWWRFDMKLVETRLLELFSKVADKTKLELERLAEQAREASTYHTGEITGPGTLVCNGCGKPMHFHKSGRIPPCSHCQGTFFSRNWEDDSA